MKRGVIVFASVLAGAVLGMFVSTAHAADAGAGATATDAGRGQAIANANACMGCHAVDRKLVGPSFQQIAAKYKGDAQAPAKLASKVKNGGSGVWGMIPMPAHQSMSDADIRTVVDWVLKGAPGK
ncbi:c-type cytochrome [Paraburkholderia sp. D15]|uniref:c-type cytochrome n=1 Tax=Paraburkholderia sp. D15 TaxID=2880218 RepID=UPI002479CE8C|nr:c-type cytochrome [Paraburkholderia sp. D15]WGS50106.1 c-type cytochrome [Paraburkholderia sp. D15]